MNVSIKHGKKFEYLMIDWIRVMSREFGDSGSINKANFDENIDDSDVDFYDEIFLIIK